MVTLVQRQYVIGVLTLIQEQEAVSCTFTWTIWERDLETRMRQIYLFAAHPPSYPPDPVVGGKCVLTQPMPSGVRLRSGQMKSYGPPRHGVLDVNEGSPKTPSGVYQWTCLGWMKK